MKFVSLNNWINEELKSGSVWRVTDQRWLQYFLDLDQTLDAEIFSNQTGKFISLSFDSLSGGQDDFGGKEIIIEFDENLIFKQGAIDIGYYPNWMKDNPEICLYVTAYKGESDYYEQLGYENEEEANENNELSWEQYLEGFEHEQEIVMKKIKYVPGLIKNVTFFKSPNDILIEMLEENGIKYEIN